MVLCFSLIFSEKPMAASSESSDRPEGLEGVTAPERLSQKTEVVVPASVSVSASDDPYSLKDGQLEAVVEINPESKEQSGIKSLNLQAKGWKARFIGGEEDTETIGRILLQQSAEKRIYLPDPSKPDKILEWQKRVIERQPHYRPLIIEDPQSQPVVLIEVHTMPRAVSFPNEQEEILNYYQSKGLMSYSPDNYFEPLYGKHRPINDGHSSMVRLRVMPVTTVAHNVAFLTDVIKGVSSLIRVFSKELSYPLHTYPTDKEQGTPRVIMSYTALEDDLRLAFRGAGFSLDENPIFGEFWPPECRDRLPQKKIVAMQFVSKILPWPLVSVQLRKGSEAIKLIEDSRPIVSYLNQFSSFLLREDPEYASKARLSYFALIEMIMGYIKEA